MLTASLVAFSVLVAPGAAQPDPELPQETRLIEFKRPQHWTFTSRAILLRGESASDTARVYRTRAGSRASRQLTLDEWVYDEFVVIQPIVRRTASAMSTTPEPTGTLELDEIVVDSDPTVIGPYQSQALYARWESAKGGTAREMELEQTIDYICYETVFDEDEAMKLGWPAAWPAAAASTFLPQQYISLDSSGSPFDSADTTIPDLLSFWTNGEDPKGIPPVELAKWLAGQVQEYVKVTRPGTTTRRNQDAELSVASGTASGFEVKSAPEIARSKQGTVHDLAVLLTAVYREAGLPARIVIGYQDSEDDGDTKLSSKERPRSWVEFAIFDEQNDELTWVPVDVARLKERSNRMQPMNQKWKYFGTHDELDDVVPIAFHFHPPTDVRSYSAAALFGITMVPAPPERATQYITFSQTRTPTRIDD